MIVGVGGSGGGGVGGIGGGALLVVPTFSVAVPTFAEHPPP